MSDDISQVVEVYISRETAQIDTASFDIPLLLVKLPDEVDNTDPMNPVTTPADVTERVQVFTTATAVADKFGVGSTAHNMAVALTSGQLRPSRFMIAIMNSAETYTQAVEAATSYNNDWYMIAIDSKAAADIEAVAEIIQSQRKMFAASTSDVGVPDSSVSNDIGSLLKDKGFDRTFLVYSEYAAADFPEVAWMGSQLPEIPGSNTWSFKGAPGVQVSRLTTSKIGTLEAKNVNFYTRLGGVNMFRNGYTSQGEWIDTMIFVDWLQARIAEQIFYRLATKKKIPMTQLGAAIVEAEIRSVIAQGIQNGGIADSPAPIITSPNVLDIPEVQRAQRVLGDFGFRVRLQGAAHRIIVRGVVTY